MMKYIHADSFILSATAAVFLMATAAVFLMSTCFCLYGATVVFADDQIPTAQELDGEKIPDSYEIKEFPEEYQLPELPTGCELVALTMMLNFYGYAADKVDLATDYLPCADYDLVEGEDGKPYGPDIYDYFVGDPFGIGTVCGPGAIVTTASRYMDDQEALMGTEDSEYSKDNPYNRTVAPDPNAAYLCVPVDTTGFTAQQLYALVARNVPVLVWITIDMETRFSPEDHWYTEDGRKMDWSINDHGAVLIGYSDNKVVIADPLEGIKAYPRKYFEQIYKSRQYQSVVLWPVKKE